MKRLRSTVAGQSMNTKRNPYREGFCRNAIRVCLPILLAFASLSVSGCVPYTLPADTSASLSSVTTEPSDTSTSTKTSTSGSEPTTTGQTEETTGIETTIGTTRSNTPTPTPTPTVQPTTSNATTTAQTTVYAPTATPTQIPATATPTTTIPTAPTFPYVNYGTLYNNTYASASTSFVSEDGRAKISLDRAANGVILVRIDNVTAICKALVTTPGGSHQYTLQPGIWSGLPANGGSGSYTVMLLENLGGTTYLPLLNQSFTVSLGGSLNPYLAASVLVNYSSGSNAVSLAGSLTGGIATTDGKVSAVYQWITSNISYDSALASQILQGAITTYVPNLDSTLSSRKGICFDYAALMAGMLRSQGIPTRLVMGYVPQGYHAWNEVYFAGTGWVVVADFQVQMINGSAYVMFDSTFGAGGMSIGSINAVSRSVEKIY